MSVRESMTQKIRKHKIKPIGLSPYLVCTMGYMMHDNIINMNYLTFHHFKHCMQNRYKWIEGSGGGVGFQAKKVPPHLGTPGSREAYLFYFVR